MKDICETPNLIRLTLPVKAAVSCIFMKQVGLKTNKNHKTSARSKLEFS